MKDVFNKSCIIQASTRNSTMKLSQLLRKTSYGQNCLFLCSISSKQLAAWIKMLIKENIFYKIRQKGNNIYLYNWILVFTIADAIFSLIFNFLDILPYISLPIFSKDHNGNIATWMLFLCCPSHKLILDIEVSLL